ncbi:MAG: hypothetical protein FJ294_01435 [Planctomycetes bacterium]|nr:hypothetical protein [Planctomycetota bacterium]
MRYFHHIALAATLVVAGCRSAHEAQPAREKANTPVAPQFANASLEDPGTVSDNWLASFGDPALDALVEEAERNNPDLAIACARRDRAIAEAGKADSTLQPKLDAVGGAQRTDTSRASADQFNLGLSISWEIDVWGRLSDATRSASAPSRSIRRRARARTTRGSRIPARSSCRASS